jgi:hypothetical protein
MLGVSAKLERHRIVERTARGRADAKAKGVKFEAFPPSTTIVSPVLKPVFIKYRYASALSSGLPTRLTGNRALMRSNVADRSASGNRCQSLVFIDSACAYPIDP